MDENKVMKPELPCERCLHGQICMAREDFEEAHEQLEPNHPFMSIEIKCSQFIHVSDYKRETRG